MREPAKSNQVGTMGGGGGEERRAYPHIKTCGFLPFPLCYLPAGALETLGCLFILLTV